MNVQECSFIVLPNTFFLTPPQKDASTRTKKVPFFYALKGNQCPLAEAKSLANWSAEKTDVAYNSTLNGCNVA